MPQDPAADIIGIRQDADLLNSFIQANRHFILASACKAVGHFVMESDDEYSIAMIAFHEAVQAYQEEKGNFYSFAGLVIRRRLTDQLRSSARFYREIDVEPSVMGGSVDMEAPQAAFHLEVQKKEMEISEQDTGNRPEGNPLRDEIGAVQQLLEGYGFSFFDLADCSPRAEKTRKACAAAVNCILARPDILAKIRSSRTLPAKELKQRSGVSAKVLERHRKYIIAAVEILHGDYPLLAEYMSYIRKELETV
ncbi:MAG: RNA polymerase subunit sigma [Parasporobacterium sp.]|nr:RNA polymerase subunit sigma [Parasporobacterium sp.]